MMLLNITCTFCILSVIGICIYAINDYHKWLLRKDNEIQERTLLYDECDIDTIANLTAKILIDSGGLRTPELAASDAVKIYKELYTTCESIGKE